MQKLEIPDLLGKYIIWAKKGYIEFLQKEGRDTEQIIKLIKKLQKKIKIAESKGDRSKNLIWFEAHEIGNDLWRKLTICALNKIDKTSKGNENLFKYLEAATQFEDLLYGLDEYYRDHTLHSLWVYFIGEYILREILPDLHNDLNWYLFNDIVLYESEYKYSNKLVNYAIKKENEINKKVNKNRDAIWCIIALCHDLGYSLEKLKNLNDKVRSVVNYFDIPNMQHTGYSLDIEHQYLVAQFLELMAMDVRMVPSENHKDKDVDVKEKVLIKCFRDDSTYWRLCRALEKKQHGILSSYLIYKILGIFADTSVLGAAEEWGLEDADVIDNIERGDILFAIAQHQFDFAHLDQLNSLADILVLSDELEEFSRYGRQLLSREYFDTMAKTEIKFDIEELSSEQEIKKRKNEVRRTEIKEISIKIHILYHVAKNGNLIDFFIRKARTLCKKYSLDQATEKIKKPDFYKIKNIEMTAKKGKNKFTFHFTHTSKHYATIEGPTYVEGRHELSCRDDELFERGTDKTLKEIITI